MKRFHGSSRFYSSRAGCLRPEGKRRKVNMTSSRSTTTLYRSGIYAGRNTLAPQQRQFQEFWQNLCPSCLGPDLGTAIVRSRRSGQRPLRNMVYVATSENRVYGFDAD